MCRKNAPYAERISSGNVKHICVNEKNRKF